MIIVTGHVVTDKNNRVAIEALCIAHSRRSRAEAGCLAHNCHYDLEAPDRLVFVEKWADVRALLAHFAVPESSGFVRAVSALSHEPPQMQIYVAEEKDPAALADARLP